MEPSPKLIIYLITKQVSTNRRKLEYSLYILSDHHWISAKTEITENLKTDGLNNSLLNDHRVKEEIEREIKDILEFSENESRAYPNIWNTMKAVLRGKFIALT